MDPVKIGTAIKTLRLQEGYTQQDLADSLGVSGQAVSKWERGLSVPDISIVMKLSDLLNVDVDNLLEGNISFLEKTWQGLLLLKESGALFSGSEAYGKPMVYFFLSYFMLAGIGDIYISCPDRDRKWMEERFGDGSGYGIRLRFLEPGQRIPPKAENTMVVYNNPFVYGPHLTKYFQRAMSRLHGISVLTAEKNCGESEILVSYDNYKALRRANKPSFKQFCTPIVFFPKKYFEQIGHVEDTVRLAPLYAEPMDNGMIEYSVLDDEALLDTALFLRYMKTRLGKELYDLREVAVNRGFLAPPLNQ